MLPRHRQFLKAAAILLLALSCGRLWASDPVADMAARYRDQVDRVLEVPPSEMPLYVRLTESALAKAGVALSQPQYLIVVDRDENMQALLLLFRGADGRWRLVGASPISSGLPGSPENFETPLGVFEHSRANADSRSEGTLDSEGLRPYGERGLRIYDFGWQAVPKGWGDGAASPMRLQMHATDPDLLERRLGTPQSKGSIRIPASLDRLIDRCGLLDAGDDKTGREGKPGAVPGPGCDATAFAGRYLIVVDSGRNERPEWNPRPYIPHRRPPAKPTTGSGDQHDGAAHGTVAQGLDGRIGVVQREGLHMGLQR
jgi:hypothetical protein